MGHKNDWGKDNFHIYFNILIVSTTQYMCKLHLGLLKFECILPTWNGSLWLPRQRVGQWYRCRPNPAAVLGLRHVASSVSSLYCHYEQGSTSQKLKNWAVDIGYLYFLAGNYEKRKLNSFIYFFMKLNLLQFEIVIMPSDLHNLKYYYFMRKINFTVEW